MIFLYHRPHYLEDFGKTLQSLARKGNDDLLRSFEASFEGGTFNIETFDVDFFLENAKEIVKDVLAKDK